MAKSTKNGQLVLRVERDLREALEREAERDRRPLSSLCRIILEDHFADEGREYRVDTRTRVA
jgi:hypothetical protein